MISLSRIKSSYVQVGDSYVMKDKNEDCKKEQCDGLLLLAMKDAELIVNKAKKNAETILASAEQQAEGIVQQADAVIQQARQEGLQAGFQSGYDEGYKKILEELKNQIQNVDVIAQSSFKVKQEIITSSEQEILKLTTVIAEKILRHQLEVDSKIILNIIRAAINELKDKEEIKILVNPALTQCIYDLSDELKKTIKGLNHIKILEDKTIPADGFMVESPDSRIDARLETQVAEITKNIMIQSKKIRS